MSLNPGGVSYRWNYSNPNKDGYSETITGTVLGMQEIQACTYNPSGGMGTPEFWPNGDPKMNIRIMLADQGGALKTFTFQPAGKEARAGLKPSVHMELFHLTGDTDLTNLIGKTIKLTTWPQNPQTGQAWQRGNPRMFVAELVEEGPYQLVSPAQLPPDMTIPKVYANSAVSGGQVMPQGVAPQNIQQPAYPAQQVQAVQPAYSAPAAMPATAAVNPMAGAAQVAQPIQNQTQMQMPSGMDPNVAAAMQAAGAVNVQPVVDGSQSVYDEQIPF